VIVGFAGGNTGHKEQATGNGRRHQSFHFGQLRIGGKLSEAHPDMSEYSELYCGMPGVGALIYKLFKCHETRAASGGCSAGLQQASAR
jgi:hypothetical protein